MKQKEKVVKKKKKSFFLILKTSFILFLCKILYPF